MNKAIDSRCEVGHDYHYPKNKDPICVRCGEYYSVGLILDLQSKMSFKEKKQLQDKLRERA